MTSDFLVETDPQNDRLRLPQNYKSSLDLRKTEKAIKLINRRNC